MELLGVLLAIILGLLALIALILLELLLFAPFRVAGRVDRWPAQRATGRVLVNWPGWLLGLEMAFDSVGQAFTLRLGPWAVWRKYEEHGAEQEEEPWDRLAEGLESLAEKIEEAEDEEEKKRGDGWPLTWRETLAQWGVLTEIARAIVRILGGLRWERLRLNGRVGLGDPALTGMLYGAYEATRRGLTPLVDVQLVPDFVEPARWGEAEGAVRIWGWRVLWPVVRMVLSRPGRRFIWALIRGWWRNRRRRKRQARRQPARDRRHRPEYPGS